jgi:hypothetical protein
VFSRWLATTLVAAQLCAVAHLALVPHTATVNGVVASAVDNLQEHLDAATHPGPHAHTPAPATRGVAEEHCTIVGLLHASSGGAATPPPFTLSEAEGEVEGSVDPARAQSRLELLLAAPKASPPAV